MDFIQYIEQQFPSYKQDLTEADLMHLKPFYDNYMTKKQIESVSLAKGLQAKDIDYTNTFEKNSSNRMTAGLHLENEIEKIKQRIAGNISIENTSIQK